MIAIVDYGVGNIFSLYSSFKYIGAEVVLTSDPDEIKKADKIILPGVGAFADAAKKLRDSGLADVVVNEVKNGKPLLGICLGMQMLFERSFEYGEHKGLGLINGDIVPMEGVVPDNYKSSISLENVTFKWVNALGSPDGLFIQKTVLDALHHHTILRLLAKSLKNSATQ